MDSTSDLVRQAFSSHLDSIYRYCHRMTGSREEAEDLAQETFVSALTLSNSVCEEDEMKGWLFGIAHNKVRHHLRRRKLETLLRLKVKNEPEFSAAIAVQELILDLPRHQREAFLLVKVEGFTSQEAAKILKVPEGTVKHRVYKGVARLQKTLCEIESMPDEVRNAQ